MIRLTSWPGGGGIWAGFTHAKVRVYIVEGKGRDHTRRGGEESGNHIRAGFLKKSWG